MQGNQQKQSGSYVLKVLVIITLTVSLLGYIDCITGEASIDTLYIACIGAVTWYTSRTIGVLCILEIIVAKTLADYFDHIKIGTHLYEWNALNYILVYFIVCFLVGNLKKVLT
jgi:hypothetical protein